MNDHASFDDTEHDDDWNGTRADRLISRIVDRRAEPDDWSGFVTLAHGDPAHWEQLLSTLRADGALRAGLASTLATADEVETPLPSLSRWRHWSGWAAAGVLALCWLGSSVTSLASPAPLSSLPAGPLASRASPATPPESAPALPPAMQPTSGNLAASGTLGGKPAIEELPLRLVGTRPGPNGRGVEVLYVRPFVERAVVDGVYSMGSDELGRPAPVKVDPATLVASNKL
jgi:hypothetical protein